MRFIELYIGDINHIRWHFAKGKTTHPFESLRINIEFPFQFTKKEALAFANDILIGQGLEWFISGGHQWTLDLVKLRSSIAECNDLKWLNGKITVEPEYKMEERSREDWRGTRKEYKTELVISLMPEDLSRELFQKHVQLTPEEILPSLSRFREDYPNLAKNGFIMMQFSDSKAHKAILRSIKSTLNKFSLNGLRSNDREYSDDLFTNIKTYMHGCSFGIAIFERLLKEDFNPNVSLEVGYMMALGKPILFLKDRTLSSLHTDIVGKLYREFDPQNSEETIPEQLENWLRDKRII